MASLLVAKKADRLAGKTVVSMVVKTDQRMDVLRVGWRVAEMDEAMVDL